MMENEVVSFIKELPLKVQTSSCKERKNVFHDLTVILQKEDATEGIVRVICRILPSLLTRYQDRKSCIFVKNSVILTLVKKYPEWTVNHLVSSLNDFAARKRSYTITKNVARSCLLALQWTCLLIKHSVQQFTNNETHLQTLIDTQAKLLYCIVAAGNNRKNEKAYYLLHDVWRKNDDLLFLYCKTIVASDPSYDSSILASFVLRDILKKHDLESKFKVLFLELFVKSVVSTRDRPAPFVVIGCTTLLKNVDHDDFKAILLPAITKAMLRNPESILECIGNVVASLSIDLSSYALDIGKGFASSLHSKDDATRDVAADGCQKLACQCADSSGLETLIKHLFNIFHGSEGKLTLATQKMSVLQGIGNLSYNRVIGNSLKALIELVLKNFISVLDVEAHEKTIIHTLEMLKLWCTKLNSEVVLDNYLIPCFEKGLTGKTATTATKIACIQCMSVYFRGERQSQGLKLVPTLTKSVEKAAAQHTSIATACEGLHAAAFLTRYISDNEPIVPVLTILLDMNKQVFISDKILFHSSSIELDSILTLCDFLLTKYKKKLIGSHCQLYKSLIYCALSSTRIIQIRAKSIIKKLTSSDIAVIENLSTEYFKFLDFLKIAALEAESTLTVNGDNTTNNNGKHYTPKLLTDVLLTLFSLSDGKLDKNNTNKLCLESLKVSHHPMLECSNIIWSKILTTLGVKPIEYIRNNEKPLSKQLVDEYDGSVCMENVVATVVNIHPESIMPAIIKRCTQILETKEFIDVTEEQYNIFKTPSGELYDKSVITKNETTGDELKNMKRESKVYSYKEQQEEIELRKELEERKRKQGKLKEPELNEKQKEAVKQQLEKESKIRENIKMLDLKMKKIISLIDGVAKGNGASLALRFKIIIPLILKNLQSPLAAPDLVPLFLRLRNCCQFKPEIKCSYFATLVAYLTLRYCGPYCDLDKAWSEEDLGKATERALTMLVESDPIGTPYFAYCFPFIDYAVQSEEANHKTLEDSLFIISRYSKMRGKKSKKLCLTAPKYLPRAQMFELLLNLIGSTGGYLQQSTENTLLDVAQSCTTDEGCDIASSEEINTLLRGLLNENEVVRGAVLKALIKMVSSFPAPKRDYQLYLLITKRVWITKFDTCEENRELAEDLWDIAELDSSLNGLADSILKDVTYNCTDIQEATAASLEDLLFEAEPSVVQSIMKKLINIYNENLHIIPAVHDNLGRVMKDPVDLWEARCGVATALEQIAPCIPADAVTNLITFYVQTGLQDRNEIVQKNMLSAGVALINEHGKELFGKLFPIFETFLKKAPASANFDAVRASVIVLMGCLACHLENTDPKVKQIVNKLIDTLSTPSQLVQEAVANCLPSLLRNMKKEETAEICKRLLNRLLNGSSYGERKGAAYGVAAFAKGLGMGYMKELDVLNTMVTAIQDKKNYKHREGALFGFEMLCSVLGTSFEPYLVHILPHLLMCFGDNSEYVRTAAEECSKMLMTNLSAHGVKLVLPSLLVALEDESWRTKTGSVELLGAMAYCAPKQLSTCLPNIVPKLIGVLNDSHIKVQESGAQALKLIGSVIRNPEVQAVVRPILDALQDPSNKVAPCLSILLETRFVHFIDSPSLALIMPVVHRALLDRTTETRRMAAEIIGNMYSLTDEKDLAPYLPTVIPGLKNSLLDSVPQVRAVSAKALGAMVRGLGETSYEELLPWLMTMLTSETSVVDRSGAAQGLSEVVGALGVDKLHSIMPDIINTVIRTDIAPHVKDGYLMMFIHMPVVFQKEFTPYIGQIIVPILKALADENEYVRDTAYQAGRGIVSQYAESAILLLLPELEKGLFDDNWRIRLSSVQLLGDLLYRISGVTGKMTTETANEDDNFGTEYSHKVIINVLGEERRNRVLAGLYMGRSDVSLAVRQAALHVWKVVVTNTPRTLREILTTICRLILASLASPSSDKRQVAARTLGDLVRKLGERILPEVIPLLEKGLESEDPRQRQGVCIGLSEIINSTSRDMVTAFMNTLVPTIKKTLYDDLPEVRRAAAKTFDSLHGCVGVSALDEILPQLLEVLKSPDVHEREIALDALQQMMAVKPRVVLPYIIPHLCSPPMNTTALAMLAPVAGDALTRFLFKIVPALMKVIVTTHDEKEMKNCQAVILAVTDEGGIRIIMDNLYEAARSDSITTRRAAIYLLSSFCVENRANYIQLAPQLLRSFIMFLLEEDPDIINWSLDAIQSITKALSNSELKSTISDVRHATRQVTNELRSRGSGKPLPGFSTRRGMIPLIPIFREGMMDGNVDVREIACVTFCDLIRLCSGEALVANMVTICGPMLRAISEKSSGNARASVLETMALLIERAGIAAKQFLPQMLVTFLKTIIDDHRQVRLKTAYALSKLVLYHSKVDHLFLDILHQIKSTEDHTKRETLLFTLRSIITPAGDKMSDQVRRIIFMMLKEQITNPEDVIRTTAAGCLGCLTRWLSPEQLNALLTEHVLVDDASLDINIRHGRSTVLFVALKENPKFVYSEYYEKTDRIILSYLQSDKVPVLMNGIRCCCYLFLYLVVHGEILPSRLLTAFVRNMNHQNIDVKQLLPKVCSYLAQVDVRFPPEFIRAAVPMLVNGTKEKNSALKANCELALISILKLRRKDDTTQEEYTAMLDAGARESLNDVVTKVLRKVSTHEVGTKEEELDCSLLT